MISKTRCWSEKEKKFYYFTGIFNSHPFIEKSSFPQYDSCKEYIHFDAQENFTGLHDKNGKEIYEGDIVRYKNKDESGTAKIEYLPGSFIFNWKDQNTLHPSIIDSAFYFGCSSELDVIGNIHENPELIK